MKPIVSIIVPCYNQAPYIAETLNSVLASDFEATRNTPTPTPTDHIRTVESIEGAYREST